MNERIKELADEAAKYSATMFLPTGEDGDTLFVQKFAELIIEECIEVVVKSDFSLKPILHEPYKTIMNNIVEHFGIDS